MIKRQITIKQIAYESLGRLWPMRRGRDRWLRFLLSCFEVKSYGFFKQKSFGKYHLQLDPSDPNDRCYYFSIAGSGYTLLASRLLRAGDCVIDVGANVGHFSATCAQFVGTSGMVHAIEANPDLFNRLQLMASDTSEGSIKAHHFAMWKTSGSVPFYVATTSGWSSLIQNNTFKTLNTVDVPALTLDEFTQTENIRQVRFLKLDTEGAETDILLGGRNFLAHQIADTILLEAEPIRLMAFGRNGSEIANLMGKNKYRLVCIIDSEKVRPLSKKNRIPGSLNCDYLYAAEHLYKNIRDAIFS